MAIVKKLSTVAALSVLAGCAAFRQFPSPGDTTEQVVAKMGQPTAAHPDGAGQSLEYTAQPMGEYAWMAHMGPDGKMVSFEQVLTGPKFASIEINRATKDDVLRTIGHPGDTSTLPRQGYEVWSYHYLENDVWYSIMNVMFDQSGVVRQMLNEPDPRYTDRGDRNR